MTPANTSSPNETALEGWKEIAAYLGRDVRTVSRWEKHEGLPVRRHQHGARATVFAYPSELDAWFEERQAAAQPAPETAPPRARQWIWAVAAAAAIALLVVAGPILNPPAPLADAAGHTGSMVARQVWAGEGVDDWGGVSPDGRYLAFIRWECGDLMLRDLNAGEDRVLQDAECYTRGYAIEARFSPDGRKVAYLWEDYRDPQNRHWEIRILEVGPDGSPGATRTLLDDGRYGLREWSRDGESLLITVGENDAHRIALASVETGEIQPLKTFAWDPPHSLLSPDGRHVAYGLAQKRGADEHDIHLLAADGSFETSLVQHPADDRLLAWAPGGSRLYFTSDREGSTDLYALPLKDGRADGEPFLVKHGVGVMRSLGLTADGRLFYGIPVGGRKVTIADLTHAGDAGYAPAGIRSSVQGQQVSPAFSPDGRLMAYLAATNTTGFRTRNKLVFRDLRSGAERAFGAEVVGFDIAGGFASQFFSPDSRRLFVSAYSRVKNRRYLATIDVESGKSRIFREMADDEAGGDHMYPAGWIDEKTVLVRDQALRGDEVRSVLMTVDTETGEAQDIFMRGRLHGSGALSPDRKNLVSLEFLDWKTSDPRPQLTVVPLGGGEPRDLLSLTESYPGTAPQAFSPDGRFVYYFTKSAKEAPYELWRIPFEGGEPESTGLTVTDENVR